jgi:centrosomal protein CEP76
MLLLLPYLAQRIHPFGTEASRQDMEKEREREREREKKRERERKKERKRQREREWQRARNQAMPKRSHKRAPFKKKKKHISIEALESQKKRER